MHVKNSLLLITGLIGLDQAILFVLQLYKPEWLHSAHNLYFTIPNRTVLSLGVFAILLIFSLVQKGVRMPLVLVAAGYVSNMITLLRLGYMVDYLALPWWYTNLADCFIVVGCFWFVVVIMAEPKTAR